MNSVHPESGEGPQVTGKLPRIWTKLRLPDPDTVEWSRVRYPGFSFLAVEAETGAAAKLKVSALAENGERIDYFEVRRGQ
ncbi:hypothetical protein WKI58_26000 [Streptomyces halotolerans]|uniref:Uncharacterized protein n=1 Tax=Streptomyces pratisoli TaxID=3139917 RepID=A0ACC6QQ28_9ACTN|nr:hypothetical protein [Streptomyces sp. NBC_00259]